MKNITFEGNLETIGFWIKAWLEYNSHRHIYNCRLDVQGHYYEYTLYFR